MRGDGKRGFFLTFEGLDGSGKTTQIQRLAKTLAKDGITPLLTRQPGGTATGDRIRGLLLDSRSGSLSPRAELAMMFADRAQAIEEVIAPALARGELVICDRFTDSTEAYQGGGRELGSEIVLELHRLVCGDLQPDLTILLLPELDASLKRARRRNAREVAATGVDENRFEREQAEFFSRVHAKYREIARREPLRVVAIEGNQSLEDVESLVMQTVSERLRQWRASSAK